MSARRPPLHRLCPERVSRPQTRLHALTARHSGGGDCSVGIASSIPDRINPYAPRTRTRSHARTHARTHARRMASPAESIKDLGYALFLTIWILPCARCTTDSAFLTTDITLAARRSRSREWLAFGTKEYQFVLDTGRLLDKTRNEAKAACMLKQADLVSIETEEELEFIKDQIRTKVRERGQQLLSHEQWWTNGISYKQSHWVWDTPTLRPVQVSALKRRTVPRTGTHYLALSHPGGWRLKIVPGNFRLRYICQRDRRPGSRSPTQAATGDPNYHVMRNLSRYDVELMSNKLRNHLLTGYNNHLPSRLSRPDVITPNKDVIRMEIDLVQIQDNVSAQELTVKQNIQTVWLDDRLSWMPHLYGGLTYLHVNMKEVWYPTIKVLTSSGMLRETCDNTDSDNLVTINSSGSLTLDRSCDVTYNCTLEKPAAFPFDHKRCRVLLFIEQDDNMVVEMIWNKGDSTTDRGFHRAWRASGLEGIQVEWTQSDDQVLITDNVCVAQLTLYLHRNVLYHILTLLVPCLFLSVVLLIILWLPQGSPVKCITTILVTSAFLLYLIIGGQHTKSQKVSYSDMFMIVMSIIGTVALLAQIYVIRLIRRNKRHASPPAFVGRLASDNKQQQKREMARCQEMAVKKDRGGVKTLEKLSEEKELMLGDQSLGLTTLGRDAKLAEIRRPYANQACDQYVTLPRERHDAGLERTPRQSQTLPKNSRQATVRFKPTPDTYVPNGTAGRRAKDYPPGRPSVVETSLTTTACDPIIKPGSSSYEELEYGYRTPTSASSPTKASSKDDADSTAVSSDWKKCITCIDRSVSFVVSAAVIFAIMVFVILFLAT